MIRLPLLARRPHFLAFLFSVAALLHAANPAAAQTAHAAQTTTYTQSPTGQYFSGIAVDAAGNGYVTGFGSYVWKGTFSNGTYTYAPLFTNFTEASQIAVDAAGSLYIADGDGKAVYKETLSSGVYTRSTLATTTANYIFGVTVDLSGNVFYTATTNLYELPYSGGTYGAPVQLNTSAFGVAYGVSLDAAGNLYVADENNSIYKFTKNGTTYIQSKLTIGGLSYPETAVPDANGNLYIHNITYFVLATLNAGVYTVTNLAASNTEGYATADPYGNIYATLGSTTTIFKVAQPPAVPATAVGTAAPQTSVFFTIDTAGTLPTLSNGNVLTQGASGLDFTLGTGSTCTGAVTAGSTCAVNVAFTPKFPGLRLGAANLKTSAGTVLATALVSGTGTGPLATLTPGLISTVAGNGQPGYTVETATTPATSASLYDPYGVTSDSAGNLYIADYVNGRVRKVTAATGYINTVAGGGSGSCTGTTNSVGDGCAATAAVLSTPTSVAVDGAGNLYIGDENNGRVRKVTVATGVISTVAGNGTQGYTASQDTGTTAATAASLNEPWGVVLDGSGNMYIADYFNNRIRKVNAAGFISTVAGGGATPSTCAGSTNAIGDGCLATSATLNEAAGVVVDSAGNLYIADTYNNRIRKVTAATGIISTVAGNGSATYVASQDTGTTAATSTSLNLPYGLTIDQADNIYIADYFNNRIRKVTAATGFISTVAGSISTTYAAAKDTGTTSATAGTLNGPTGIGVDSAGNLFIADQQNQRIRKVSTTGDIVFPTATAAGTSDTTDNTQMLSVSNIGNQPLVFASQVETGSSYTLANPMTGGCVSNGTVAAGGSCLIGATYAPVTGATGNQGGYVTVTDNSLNATGAVQYVLLEGKVTAGAVTVIATNTTAAFGATSATLRYIISYAGTAADVGAQTVTVNGAAAATAVCVDKASHMNCTVAYNPSALGLGNYPIVVTIAADAADGYVAGSGMGTLSITATGMAQPVPVAARPVVVATPMLVVPAAPVRQGGVVMSVVGSDPDASPVSDSVPAACSVEAQAAASKRGNALADCPR